MHAASNKGVHVNGDPWSASGRAHPMRRGPIDRHLATPSGHNAEVMLCAKPRRARHGIRGSTMDSASYYNCTTFPHPKINFAHEVGQRPTARNRTSRHAAGNYLTVGPFAAAADADRHVDARAHGCREPQASMSTCAPRGPQLLRPTWQTEGAHQTQRGLSAEIAQAERRRPAARMMPRHQVARKVNANKRRPLILSFSL